MWDDSRRHPVRWEGAGSLRLRSAGEEIPAPDPRGGRRPHRVSDIHHHAGELVRSWLGGDPSSLFALVDLLRPVAMRECVHILRDEALAEDVFVETMTELVDRLSTLREPAAVVVYARRMARSRSVDQLRRRAERDHRSAMVDTHHYAMREPERATAPVERLAARSTPETRALRDESFARIQQCLEDLNEPGRSILRGLLEGESIAAVARRLRLSETTAHRAAKRARSILAARLAGFDRHEVANNGGAV